MRRQITEQNIGQLGDDREEDDRCRQRVQVGSGFFFDASHMFSLVGTCRNSAISLRAIEGTTDMEDVRSH